MTDENENYMGDLHRYPSGDEFERASEGIPRLSHNTIEGFLDEAGRYTQNHERGVKSFTVDYAGRAMAEAKHGTPLFVETVLEALRRTRRQTSHGVEEFDEGTARAAAAVAYILAERIIQDAYDGIKVIEPELSSLIRSSEHDSALKSLNFSLDSMMELRGALEDLFGRYRAKVDTVLKESVTQSERISYLTTENRSLRREIEGVYERLDRLEGCHDKPEETRNEKGLIREHTSPVIDDDDEDFGLDPSDIALAAEDAFADCESDIDY